MSTRRTGLKWVNEVKVLLRMKGYKVEGPGNKLVFVNRKLIPCHKDYFDAFDLISYRDLKMEGHQVTDLSNKASHVTKMRLAGMVGYLWCRIRPNDYRVWIVYPDLLEEIFMDNL